jgi:hypothetical protein
VPDAVALVGGQTAPGGRQRARHLVTAHRRVRRVLPRRDTGQDAKRRRPVDEALVHAALVVGEVVACRGELGLSDPLEQPDQVRRQLRAADGRGRRVAARPRARDEPDGGQLVGGPLVRRPVVVVEGVRRLAGQADGELREPGGDASMTTDTTTARPRIPRRRA